MSGEDAEVVRKAYEGFVATGELSEDVITDDFVWDMSNFRGWPEQQTYEGIEGARTFLREWTDAWDDWELEVEALHEVGGKVVAVVRQRGRSKASGLPVEMVFGQVWTVRGGKEQRMDMYADPAEAFDAARAGDAAR